MKLSSNSAMRFNARRMNRIWRVVLVQAMLLAVCSGAHADDHFFDSDGVSIRYRIEGSGDPMVLIHGLGLNIELGWEAPGITAALSENYRVISMDVRGHGKSGKPHDPTAYGAPQLSLDVSNLLDHLGIAKAHIVGYSMGGNIALDFLISHPDRCQSVVVAATGWIDPDYTGPDFGETLADSLERGDGLKPLVVALTPEGTELPSDDLIAEWTQWFLDLNDEKAVIALLRGTPKMRVTREQLKKNTLPALSVVGENDSVRVLSDALTANMPNTRQVVIPGTDHGTAALDPLFVKTIEGFCGNHPIEGRRTAVEDPT
jgi:pimeloyl-ACP methyl ester carboxylesterase